MYDLKHKTVSFAILFYSFFIYSNYCFSQNIAIDEYQFISPLPNSTLNQPESSIIIRQGKCIDETTLTKQTMKVFGSKSGVHKGSLSLSADKRVLIFQPTKKFNLGEKVLVNLFDGIMTTDGDRLTPLEFSFNICERRIDYVRDVSYSGDLKVNEFSNGNTNESTYVPNSLHEYLLISVITSNNPSDGYVFISPYDLSLTRGDLIILDNSARPIFYQQTRFAKFDFKLQLNGMLTYWDINTAKFYAMDSSYTIVDTFSCKNGYSTDMHDLQILPNGHSLLLSYDPQIVRMDTVVQGGDTAAVVIGLIIQELDEQKNLVFLWRSWDYFQITDATDDIDLTAHTIDYVHGNAIEADNDGNLLLSSKYLDEITKINRQTGEVIWRWGGLKSKNNEFQFLGDPITFSHQHDIRRLPSGNITLYDNGVLHLPKISRSLEYELDEENKIATLVWKFNYDPIEYYSSMGNSQRLPDNNTFIGWGWSTANPIKVTEVRVDDTVSFELEFPDLYVTYRAFRFPWRTNLFFTDPESIYFESIPVGDSAVTTINLVSNSSEEINITDFFNSNNAYIVEHTVPFVLMPYGSELFDVKFKPVEEGYFKDTLHIRSDTDTSRIAQIMVLAGRTDTTFSSIEQEILLDGFKLEQNYPNPFNSGTTIKYSIPTQSNVRLRVYNPIGDNITDLINTNQSTGRYEVNWDASNVASGIYFYSIDVVPNDGSEMFRSVKKMVLLK